MEHHTEAIEPVWLYRAEEDAIVEISSLQLIIWAKGFSICGYSENGIPQEIKTIFFQDDWDVDMMESVFINDPLFAGPEPFTQVWLVEERNILVPQPLYEIDYAEEWIRKFHFLEQDEVIFTGNMAPYLDAHIVFPIKERLKLLLQQYMEEAPLDALSKLALSNVQHTKDTLIDVFNLPKVILLSLQHNGRFTLHQTYAYEDINDIVYKMAIILQEKDLNQDQIQVRLSGIAPFWNNILDELPAYFPQVNIPADTTATTLDFFKKLYQCAS